LSWLKERTEQEQLTGPVAAQTKDCSISRTRWCSAQEKSQKPACT
jgi:hypothetical protein